MSRLMLINMTLLVPCNCHKSTTRLGDAEAGEMTWVRDLPERGREDIEGEEGMTVY